MNPLGEKKHFDNFLIENYRQKESPKSHKRLKTEIIDNKFNGNQQFLLNYNLSPRMQFKGIFYYSLIS